ncbi:hypothetical protein BZK37_16745, partial [Enterococcus casseliflavus]
PGPSIIIAYTPCITHGLAGGMRQSLKEAQEAVASGYWSLYRYNPLLAEKGKQPMTLDFKKPAFDQMPAFMQTQVRFASLHSANPNAAQALFEKTVSDAKTRFYNYARLAGQEEKIRAKLEKTDVTDENSPVESGHPEQTSAVKSTRVRRERQTLSEEQLAERAARRAARAKRRQQE